MQTNPIAPIKVLTFGSKGETGFIIESLSHLPDEDPRVQQMRALLEMAPEMFNFILGVTNDVENSLDLDDPLVVGAYLGLMEQRSLKILKQINEWRGSDIEDTVVMRLRDIRALLGEATRQIPVDLFTIGRIKRRVDNTIEMLRGR